MNQALIANMIELQTYHEATLKIKIATPEEVILMFQFLIE